MFSTPFSRISIVRRIPVPETMRRERQQQGDDTRKGGGGGGPDTEPKGRPCGFAIFFISLSAPLSLPRRRPRTVGATRFVCQQIQSDLNGCFNRHGLNEEGGRVWADDGMDDWIVWWWLKWNDSEIKHEMWNYSLGVVPFISGHFARSHHHHIVVILAYRESVQKWVIIGGWLVAGWLGGH